MSAAPITKVGQVLFDTHDGLRNNAERKGYELRNVVQWRIPEPATDRAVTPAIAFVSYLDLVRRCAVGQVYTNKMLIVIGEPGLTDGWWPAAFSYDGSRAGVCEVRVKP